MSELLLLDETRRLTNFNFSIQGIQRAALSIGRFRIIGIFQRHQRQILPNVPFLLQQRPIQGDAQQFGM